MEVHTCRVAAALVSGSDDIILDCLKSALGAGVTVSELREVILTSYLFDGYPTALEGFRLLTGLTGSPEEQTDLEYNPDNIAAWRERGEPLCRTIYGPQYEVLMERVAEIAPELADAMIVEGYGKVLSRNGLSPRVRELCVVTILTAKYRPRQLLSHALGALRLGADADQLYEVLEAVEEVIQGADIHKARRVMEEALRKVALP